MKRLYRSTEDRVIAGVCGGLSEYANIDVNVIRLLIIFGTMITGIFPLVILYVIAMFLLPEKPQTSGSQVVDGEVSSKTTETL